MSISLIHRRPQSEKARGLVVILLKAHGLSLKVEPFSRSQASSLYPYRSNAYDAHTMDKASARPAVVPDPGPIAIDMKDILSRVSSFDADDAASALGLNNGKANNEHES